MNDLWLLPDEASDDESTSKLMVVEEECFPGVASFSVRGWECASSCRRIKGSGEGHWVFPKNFSDEISVCTSLLDRYLTHEKAPNNSL